MCVTAVGSQHELLQCVKCCSSYCFSRGTKMVSCMSQARCQVGAVGWQAPATQQGRVVLARRDSRRSGCSSGCSLPPASLLQQAWPPHITKYVPVRPAGALPEAEPCGNVNGRIARPGRQPRPTCTAGSRGVSHGAGAAAVLLPPRQRGRMSAAFQQLVVEASDYRQVIRQQTAQVLEHQRQPAKDR